MHDTIMNWLVGMAGLYPQAFEGRVLECGAYNINGSLRPLFLAEEYVGLDWRGVDAVGLIHAYRGRPDGYFDTVVCTQTLEHDPFWRESLGRMVELVAPGGNLLLSWAGPGWAAHEVATAPVAGYYGNLTLAVVEGRIDELAEFEQVYRTTYGEPQDCVWAGIGKR